MHLGLVLGAFLIGKLFLTWRKVLDFLCKLAIMHSLFFQVFVEMSQRALGLWCSCSPHTFRAYFSTSFLCLCSTELCLSPGGKSKTFVPEKCCPTSVWPLVQSHLVLSHSVTANSPWLLLPTVLGWCHSHPALGV